MLVLTVAALAVGRGGWLPRAIVAVSAVGAVAFAVSNPDGRIAAHNAERFERTGRVDVAYASGLSADAAPGLARLGAEAPCVVERIRSNLRRPTGSSGPTSAARVPAPRSPASRHAAAAPRLSLSQALRSPCARFYESFWADAPDDPRALAVGAPPRAAARRGAGR